MMFDHYPTFKEVAKQVPPISAWIKLMMIPGVLSVAAWLVAHIPLFVSWFEG